MEFDPSGVRTPTVVKRREWSALESTSTISPLLRPVNNVFLTYANGVPRCSTKEECTKAIQDLQKLHMDEGAPDLPYSFLLGGDKRVYEGRGWEYSVPPPPESPDLAGKCIVLAFIGPLRENYQPTMRDFKSAYEIINFGIDNQEIVEKWIYKYIIEDWNTYNSENEK